MYDLAFLVGIYMFKEQKQVTRTRPESAWERSTRCRSRSPETAAWSATSPAQGWPAARPSDPAYNQPRSRALSPAKNPRLWVLVIESTLTRLPPYLAPFVLLRLRQSPPVGCLSSKKFWCLCCRCRSSNWLLRLPQRRIFHGRDSNTMLL